MEQKGLIPVMELNLFYFLILNNRNVFHPKLRPLISASLSDISVALFSEELVGVSNSIVLAGSDLMIPDSALGRLVT